MGMYIVEKVTFGGEMALIREALTAWAVINRKTHEVIGEYEQLSTANSIASMMNRGIS